ncbi:MAG: hypothetical protein ACRDWY_10675 [Actinomycetes bacterium]
MSTGDAIFWLITLGGGLVLGWRAVLSIRDYRRGKPHFRPNSVMDYLFGPYALSVYSLLLILIGIYTMTLV